VPLGDGTFVLVLEDMVKRDLFKKSAVKALMELRGTRKLTAIKVDAAVVGFSGVEIKVCGRRLKGYGNGQVAGYSALRELEQKLENSLTPALLAKLAIIAVAAPQPAAQPQPRFPPPLRALAVALPSLTRTARPKCLRPRLCRRRRPRRTRNPPLRWPVGRGEDLFTTCPAQVPRMKAAKAHDPIFGITNDITSGDVDELERLYRLFYLPEYGGAAGVMREELATYKARITLISPLAERLDSDGQQGHV
jgi:hypothetical protein